MPALGPWNSTNMRGRFDQPQVVLRLEARTVLVSRISSAEGSNP